MQCKALETMSKIKIRLINNHRLGELAYQSITAPEKDAVNHSNECINVFCFSCAGLHYFH